MKSLKQHIIDEFSSEPTQSLYLQKAEEGLWPAEETLVKKFFKPGSAVLDIGCGTGRTTIPLFRMEYRVTGIDITPKMIENAKKIAATKSLDIKYEIGDAVNLQFKDGSFNNAIFSNNGWTQIPAAINRLRALQEVFRILAPGGYFIFTTHVRTWYGFKWFWTKQWIKHFVLKPLGFRIQEVDFGDRFFERENSGTRFSQNQFIHIPKTEEVARLIQKAGLDLIVKEMAGRLGGGPANSYSPMFFVCKKPGA